MRTIISKKPALINLSKDLSADAIRSEIIQGLTARNRYIHPKFFYDEGGMWLFTQITRLDDYYLTRTEKSILKAHATEIMREMPGNNIVELASGDCTKIAILLNSSMGLGRKRINYFPYEISADTVKDAISWLSKIFPYVEVQGVVADIDSQFYAIPQVPDRLICFFGSTIGNYPPEDALSLMSNLSGLMRPGEQLLIGMDMVKDKKILEKAYNDSQGLTAAFNKNVLFVMNHLIEADFDPENFEHLAFFNEKRSRIEMHLVAKEDVKINSPYLDKSILIKKGESIHTENSRKFSVKDIEEMAYHSHLKIDRIFTDADEWFSLVRFVIE